MMLILPQKEGVISKNPRFAMESGMCIVGN